jgi:hypothetical protein
MNWRKASRTAGSSDLPRRKVLELFEQAVYLAEDVCRQ